MSSGNKIVSNCSNCFKLFQMFGCLPQVSVSCVSHGCTDDMDENMSTWACLFRHDPKCECI